MDSNKTTAAPTYKALRALADDQGLVLLNPAGTDRYQVRELGAKGKPVDLIVDADLAVIADFIASWPAAEGDTSSGTDSDDQTQIAVGGHTNGHADPPAVAEALGKPTNRDGEQSVEPSTGDTTPTETTKRDSRTSPTRRPKRKTPEITGVHPYALKFPMMSSDELADLADDINSNGQRDPIDITPDGLILEGRNRYEACKIAGITPVVKVYEGSDLANYVISKNVNRRHMKPGQRAMATARVLHEDGRRVDGRWVRGSVINPETGNPEFGITGSSKTWQNAMSKAGIILDYAPELAEGVANGKGLDGAFLIAEQRHDPTKKPPKSKKKDPEPTATQMRATRIADALSELQKTKTGPAKKISEVEMAQIRAIRRECDRIINNDINGIPS